MSDRRIYSPPDDADAQARTVRQFGPDGPIWKAPGWVALARALAEPWLALAGRIADMLDERFAATTDELLDEWIRELALDVDPCVALDDDDAKKAAIRAAVAAVGDLSPSTYYAIADALGVEVEILEGPTAPYTAPECGVAECGDELAGPLAGLIWQVIAPAATPIETRAILECQINRARPAHTAVEYLYTA